VTHLDSEHDFELTHARVSSKELWPKKIWSTYLQPSIKSNSNQLELLTDAKQATRLLANNLQVICVVRNEMIMLPHFLAHYRQLGVKSFIFVDNCSNDGSREYLYNQDDVVLYSADTDYKHSHYGVAWQQAILGNHCLGKWVLVADADEFFIFTDCEHRTLSDFIKDIEQENCNASCIYMIDMYPKGDLDEADFTKQSPFTVAAWFDNPSVIPWSLHFKSGYFSNSLMTVSCLRHRLVPEAARHEFVSQKYALFRYAPWQRFSEGLHCATNLRISKQKTYFAHFKYHAGFKAKVETEIHRGQHFNNAAEYKYYSTILNESKGNFYQTGISEKYTTSANFYNAVRLE
jgi:glycosyltransferase involved in cell wall biosynthesis